MQYINCEEYAAEILETVRQIPDKKKLVIITAGDDPASKSYVKGKLKDCAFCEVPCEHIVMSEDADENDLGMEVVKGNCDDEVGGIIVQLPLPKGWDEKFLSTRALAHKDVDGFRNDSLFKPCTPEGIVHLLKHELGDLTGKTALVVGRGRLVGEPCAKMLIDEDCTVTVAHSKTINLDEELSRHHDIVVSAVGKANFLDLCKCDADIVIDAGVNRNEQGKLCGDCYNFDATKFTNMKVTPVPKGIGLMTRAMLMKHMGDAACM